MPGSKRLHVACIIALFIVYIVNGLIAIPDNSVTYDEMDHWSYGKRILMMKPEKIYPYDDASAMPVSGLNALPRAVEQLIHPELEKTDGGFSDIMQGRYITLFLCLLSGLLIYFFSKEMAGRNAGLFSLFLFVFCPNLNAHGTLLTTDAYSALFTVAVFYSFWRFIKQSGWKNFLIFCVILAAAQLVKQSLLHLYIIFFFTSLLLLVWRKTIFSNLRKNILRAFVLLGITVIVINTGFFFKGTGTPLSDYDVHSSAFRSLRSSWLSNLPLPLPVPFVEGTDLVIQMNDLGAGHPEVSPQNYLLGEFKKGEGFQNYYLVVFLFKTPIHILLGIGMIILSLLVYRENFHQWRWILFLGGSIFYFICLFSLFNNSQVGLRHIILVYPLLYVALGSLFRFNFFRKFCVPVFILYSLFTFYKFFPNLISYHNEFVASKNTYKIMADSNIDYGQSYFRYLEFNRKHPEYRIPGKVPAAGKFIVPVDEFLDTREQHKFDWLKDHFKPAGHFDHCYLLFNISEEEISSIHSNSRTGDK